MTSTARTALLNLIAVEESALVDLLDDAMSAARCAAACDLADRIAAAYCVPVHVVERLAAQ